MSFSSACAIAEEDTKTVVITGGIDLANGVVLKKAIRYGLNGWIEYLEELNTARKNHACTSYILRLVNVSSDFPSVISRFCGSIVCDIFWNFENWSTGSLRK